MIYLDNSATTYPKPRQVREAVIRILNASGNPGRSGHSMSLKAGEEIYNARHSASLLFHCPKEENVIFTSNCTEAINIVLKGILKNGDHAVISDLEHNAVMRPLHKLEKQGITFSKAKVYPGDNDRTVDSFRKAINARTKIIFCTHASNVFGIRLPVERLSALAHEYGILFGIDAAQSAGIVPIDMEDIKPDFVCVPGHKGLYGPMGTGMLLIGTENVPDSLIEGGTGTMSMLADQPDELPDHLESGTPNLPGICGLRAGMDFVRRVTEREISAHEFTLVRRLYRELAKIKRVRLYTPEPNPEHYVPILSFNIEGMDSEETASRLNNSGIAVRAGLHCAPTAHEAAGTLQTGTVRISPSYFTGQSDITTLIRALK